MKSLYLSLIFLFAIIEIGNCQSKQANQATSKDIQTISSTYLGNNSRNYYGNIAPDTLELIWKFDLGTGKTQNPRKPYDFMVWSGAGWTGQAATIREDSSYYLIQPSFSHFLYKINAKTGKEVWRYKYDDVLKGSPTLWENTYTWGENRYLIFQGSRRGNQNNINSSKVYSLRAISYFTGCAQWHYNITRTRSYSRDCDASPLVYQDTLYAPLENGYFLKADPRPDCGTNIAEKKEPKEYSLTKMYSEEDAYKHRNNVILEGSPTLLGNRIYMCGGSGWIKGYNIDSDSVDWQFYTGGDMDGTPAVTNDSCLIVTLEKQYIPGKGGVFKLDPSKSPEESVVWYFPTENKHFAFWDGGVLGSACVNDAYINPADNGLSAILAMDGFTYVVDHEYLSGDSVLGPLNKFKYPTPQLAFKYETGSGISSPIITDNKLIVACYNGIYLFEYNNNCSFKLIDHYPGTFESTPVVLNGCVYISSRDGNLYCLGRKHAVK